MPTKFNTRNITLMALFIVGSGILGLIKIPSPLGGSIAMDSCPGYFIAGYLGPVFGGIVGAVGHLASAFTGGFPFGWIHVVVAIQMFLWCFLFGLIIRSIDKTWAIFPAFFAAVLLNGVIAPMSLGLLKLLPMEMAKGLILILVFASSINAAIACVAIFVFSRRDIPGI